MKEIFLIVFIVIFSSLSYCQKDDFYKIQEYDSTYINFVTCKTEYFNDSNFNIGVSLYNNSKFKKAIEKFNLVILSDSTFSRAYAFRAKSYIYLEQYDKALIDLNKVIYYTPKDGGVYLERGNIYKIKNDIFNAINDYGKAIELISNNYYAYYQRADSYLNKGEFDKALTDINKFIEIRPDISYGYYLRAFIRMDNNSYENVLEDLTQSIKINPDNNNSYLLLGNYFYNKHKFRKTINIYKYAIERDSTFYYFYNNRSNAYIAIGKYEKAIEDCNKALAIEPDYKTFYLRGKAKSELKRRQEAIIDLTESIKLDSNFTYSLLERANNYYYIHDYKSALKDYENLMRLDSNQKVPYMFLLIKEWYIKDDKGLVDLYSINLRINKNALDYYYRGCAKQRLGDKIGACQDFIEAKKYGEHIKEKEFKTVCE